MNMTYHSVIITAGTSSLARFNAAGAWLSEQSDLVVSEGVPPRWRSAEGFDAASSVEEARKRLSSLPGAADPMKVSAEYSTMHALRQAGRLGRSTRVTLVATDTLDGRLASAIASHYIARDFDAYVEEIFVADFNVDDRKKFQQGLGNVLASISKVLREHDPSTTCFAPIGGFKVMTSLAYLLGCFHGYPSVYLHEALQVLHTIPAVPVRVTPEELKDVAPLIHRMVLDASGMSAAAFELTQEERQKYSVDRFGWLFEQVEGSLFSLNAMGIFLAKNPDYLQTLGPRVLLSDKAYKVLEGDHTRIVGELRDLVDQLLNESGTPSTIFHEHEWKHRVKGTLIWRLAKQPAGTIRFTWRVAPDGETIQVNHIWTKHDEYEKGAPTELVAEPASGERDISVLVYTKG